MNRLSLRNVTRSNVQAAFRLRVSSEQQRFVADYTPIAAIALAKAYVHAFGFEWLPYAIYREEEMVGFVALAYEDSEEKRSIYWMFHFFIDARYQGQRYGREALELLMQEAKEHLPTCQVIQLTVHPENRQAQHIYTQVGFRPTSELLDGEPVYRLPLQR